MDILRFDAGCVYLSAIAVSRAKRAPHARADRVKPARLNIASMYARYCLRNSAIRGDRRDIVVAVGHSETALQQVRVAAGWVREPLRDPDSEKIRRLEIRAVQGVDVRPQPPADGAGQCSAIRDRGECVQPWFQRRDSFHLDAGFVHETGAIEIADLAVDPRSPARRILRHPQSGNGCACAICPPKWRRGRNSTYPPEWSNT